MTSEVTRQAFFRLAYGRHEGWACIGLLQRGAGKMNERWFHLPTQFNDMLELIDRLAINDRIDVYYCPQLFESKSRRKDNVKIAPTLWADLDECNPTEMEERPSLVVETSPERFQGLWILENGLPGDKAAELSKRIAYKYADQGCDRSGWDLTQLLRVPGTRNNKYINTDTGAAITRIVGDGSHSIYRENEFDDLPPVTLSDYEKIPFPEKFPPGTGRDIMEIFRFKLTQKTFQRFETIPEGDWSRELFALEMSCYEAGMSREQVYKVVTDAACNKFARAGLGENHVWGEVCRAYGRHTENLEKVQIITKKDEPLLTDEERSSVENVRTFVEDYIDWASKLGDAAVQYHQGGAFIILSALLAGSVSLPTSFGRVVPNLWFMILADTTLTRKSTAMDIAVDLLVEVDPDAIMATDGSIEGLMQGLSTRPGRPSVFLRDEFSGLIEQITKKDYYAGMAETLTKLYDGKMQKRLLRKEIIEVRDPVLVLFAGGIKSRVQQLLKLDHISSGFIPRFLFLTAESDISKVQPLGPPTLLDTSGKAELLQQMIDMRQFYHGFFELTIEGGKKIEMPKRWEAELTPAAWTRYNKFEKQLTGAGMKTERPDLMTPLFDRLAKSTLKAIVLLAASRRKGDDVIIDVDDVLLGIKYAEGWQNYAIEVVNGIGMSIVETQMDNILGNIRKHPGISRSVLMRTYRLSAREADAIFITLEQRGLVTKSLAGKGVAYNALM